MPAATGREALRAPRAKQEGDALRQRVGEFVGNVFYGTLLKQMESSGIKGKLMHGGRGEEVFRGQLNMELARRMGQSPGDPIAEKMYEAFRRQEGVAKTKTKSHDGGIALDQGSSKGISLGSIRDVLRAKAAYESEPVESAAVGGR